MSIDLHLEILHSVTSMNPEVTGAADAISEYTEMAKRGEITVQEYASLLEDIKRQIKINEHMVELENLEKLNTAINGLLAIARAI